jgi:hypothetical protein
VQARWATRLPWLFSKRAGGVRSIRVAALMLHPELYGHRAAILDKLATLGFLPDLGLRTTPIPKRFSAVDVIARAYGIEVCGIHWLEDALDIQSLLQEWYPTWRTYLNFKNHNDGERGWKVVVFRDDFDPRWVMGPTVG